MNIKKISLIVGTRPQIIKSQKLVEELRKNNFDVKIIHTGQHYDFNLSKKFFKEFDLPSPSLNLCIGAGTQSEQIAKIILKLEKLFQKSKPDLVIIPGDTTSAIASAIVSSKCKIKFAHLEAGARSNEFYLSEEINRRLIDHCANFLFAPTKNCFQNLKNEGVLGRKYFVGDTMYDLFLDQVKKHKLQKYKKNIDIKKIFLTIHRNENIENYDRLTKICKFVNELSDNKFEILFPTHPHTKNMIKKFRLKIKADLIQPLNYLESLKCIMNSSLVITDSGGLQKESYWMGKPCITLRDSTEWIETIREKSNFLFSISNLPTIRRIKNIINSKINPKPALFGSGKASIKIVKIIERILNE